MKDSFSKKESVEIISRALTLKDDSDDQQIDSLNVHDLEALADDFGITNNDLKRAITEITHTKERKRDELYPEIVTARWIDGRLSEQEIEDFFAELKLEFGSHTIWNGSPAEVHKMGKIWEFRLSEAVVTLQDLGDGYQLRVLKPQFFHGNKGEAFVLAIPVAFILGLLPVAAAVEWLNMATAFFAGAASYIASFSVVKSFINRTRTKTRSKLLHIINFADQKLQALIDNSAKSPEDSISFKDERTAPQPHTSLQKKKSRF